MSYASIAGESRQRCQKLSSLWVTQFLKVC